ncbi:MAG: SsrA-binding protein SmpB [Verrucomicrobiota bacterium JB022]|nr:SsrA-binding protein SmpB [Verrucomicrobiota bacterium JB022]
MARKNSKSGERYCEIRNSKAQRDYFVDETLEAGLVLQGTEVKSIRAGGAQISESFVRIDRGEAILYHANIQEYAFGNFQNHNPYRPRKLLLHRKEILKWEQAIKAGGLAIIPLKMYFKNGMVKVQLGLCRGKREYDKREDLKEAVDRREMDRAIKAHLHR